MNIDTDTYMFYMNISNSFISLNYDFQQTGWSLEHLLYIEIRVVSGNKLCNYKIVETDPNCTMDSHPIFNDNDLNIKGNVLIIRN